MKKHRLWISLLACLLTLLMSFCAAAEMLPDVAQNSQYSGTASLKYNDGELLTLKTFNSASGFELEASGDLLSGANGPARLYVSPEGTVRIVYNGKQTTFSYEDLMTAYVASNGMTDQRVMNYLNEALFTDLMSLADLAPWLTKFSDAVHFSMDGDDFSLSLESEEVTRILKEFCISAKSDEKLLDIFCSLKIWDYLEISSSQRKSLVQTAFNSIAAALESGPFPLSANIQYITAKADAPAVYTAEIELLFGDEAIDISLRGTHEKEAGKLSMSINGASGNSRYGIMLLDASAHYDANGALDNLYTLLTFPASSTQLTLEAKRHTLTGDAGHGWNASLTTADGNTQAVISAEWNCTPHGEPRDLSVAFDSPQQHFRLLIGKDSLFMNVSEGRSIGTFNGDWNANGYHMKAVSTYGGSYYETFELDGSLMREGDDFLHSGMMQVKDSYNNLITASLAQRVHPIQKEQQQGYNHTLLLEYKDGTESDYLISWDSTQLFGEGLTSPISALDTTGLEEVSFEDFINNL